LNEPSLSQGPSPRIDRSQSRVPTGSNRLGREMLPYLWRLKMKEWQTLADYIKELLLDGKRSPHPDFQLLFRLFGKDHITEIAKTLLKEEKEKSKNEIL
jgi:predicted CopG family antitoxin